MYPQRVRLGVPALFHRLAQWGYDVWVYSSGYYSMDEITHLLGHHRARVTCAVTGTARKGPRGARMDEQLEAMLARKYTQTVHIDQKSILFVDSQSRRFEEYLLSGTDESWSREIIGLMGKKDVHANS